MRNGYFQLTSDPAGGYGVAIYRPEDGGDPVQIGEIVAYLDENGIGYDRKRIEKALMSEEDCICHLGQRSCPSYPEFYQLTVSEDGMEAYVRFVPPSGSGGRLTLDDFMSDMKYSNIIFGLETEVLRTHFSTAGMYCTDILVAKGQKPVQGEDARIEYCFDTDMHRRPAQREDGSVDYFHITTINQCRKGDLLAQIIPEKHGTAGHDIYGKEIKPREVHKAYLKYGRNMELSEDKLSLISLVDGHVSLVDGQVFVSDVYKVKGVDVSTGNLDFEGSIQVDGDVAENFEVKAGGNVVVNGLVEGARIIAGGSIIISKGMNGMQKGYLKAGGDIVVKYLENVRAVSGGYLQAEAIMHSKVSAGGEVYVDGRKGLIVGGHVQAGVKLTAKNIGAGMGATTILEVGVNPLIKTQYSRMQKAMEDHNKTISNAEVILDNFKEKISQGHQYDADQFKYMKSVRELLEEKRAESEQMKQRMERLLAMMEVQKTAELVVNNQIHPGTTIIIGDASRTLQSSFHYCKFVREKGEVTMKPIM